MDDFPACPTSPEHRPPTLSVVIPVRNGGLDFERCLRGLRASHWTDYELIVIDDGSSDDTADRARKHGARVIRHEKPLGPAASRNDGAEAAFSDLIFFIDGDVVVHPDTLTKVVERFQENPGLAALFGSYDAEPSASGLVSGSSTTIPGQRTHSGPVVARSAATCSLRLADLIPASIVGRPSKILRWATGSPAPVIQLRWFVRSRPHTSNVGLWG